MLSLDSKTRARAQLVDLVDSQTVNPGKEDFRLRHRTRTLAIRGQARPYLSVLR
jgi:hypothetical protein